MVYGASYNLFRKEDTSLTNEEKIEKLKKYPTKDLLTLVRNFEESPDEFEPYIVKAILDCLYDKGIMCMW